jgi:anti-sigma factor ChrR (cupin superfamily)
MIMKMSERPRIDANYVDPYQITTIIDQDNFQSHLTVSRNVCDPNDSYGGVGEQIIPVDLSRLPDARMMKVAGGTKVPPHAHDGPVVRIMTAGEASVNGKSYSEGDWMVIPDGVEYSIETKSGYTALWVCAKC